MEEILDKFRKHNMSRGEIALSDDLRQVFIEVVKVVIPSLPKSRERSLVVTHLEEALFYTTACIARNGVANKNFIFRKAQRPGE